MTYIPQSPETYKGSQVIINSDRLLFNAKKESILLFSDKVIGFSTNGSFHFDTSPEEANSKFVVNSPKIYLGLEFDNSLPQQSAVLAEELITSLTEILDLIGKVYLDLATNVSFTSTSPGTPTGVFTGNFNLMKSRLRKIEKIKRNLEDIKSQNTKLV